jgi:hypothetical protein
VRRELTRPGTLVTLATPAENVLAELVDLPFQIP